jgi:hypothetical protein
MEKRPNHRGHRGTQGKEHRGNPRCEVLGLSRWRQSQSKLSEGLDRPSRYAAPNRTDTSFDTPGSCMVTP